MKRIDEIKQTLRLEGKVFVNELSLKYQVSEVSIRKDLSILEKQGFARKFYGGAACPEATLPAEVATTDFYQDSLLSSLAERACLEIQDGDCIFLGSGRTCCILARKLGQFKNLTVVTNNISALNDLLGRVTKVYLIGGEVTSTDQQTLFSSWDQPQSFTDNIYVNKAFTSISGLDLKAGLTVTSVISTYVYRHISAMAHQWYLMADHSKFDRISIYPVAELSQIQAIISDSIPPKFRQFFVENAVQILTP